MRLIRLVMQGFGTYLEKQDLDFTVLKDKNIFVISGDTGAGKTTVFDAINYALYGDASGKDREGISFRSDFATPEEPTYVELWFALRDKTYYVRREPSYIEKKQKGEGEKEHKPYAELKLPDGKIITGIKPVTMEIEKLLGINKEQFRQIVMIPQGEFKKLLTADSQEREKIFRKIFGTEILERIQNKVNAEANELDKEVKFKRNERDAKLRDFECKETDEELFRILQSGSMNLNEVFTRAVAVIKQDKAAGKVLAEDVKSAEEMLESLNKALVQGENTNKKFRDYAACDKALEELKSQQELYQQKREALEKARKALTLRGFEEKWESKKSAADAYDKALKAAKTELEVLKIQYEKSQEELKTQKAKENERKELEKGLSDAEKLKQKAEKYESCKEKTANLKKETEALKSKITELTEKAEKSEVAVKEADATIEKINEAEKNKLQLENELKELSLQNEELDKLKVTLEALQKQKEEYADLKEKFNIFNQSFEVLKLKYETAEESFRRGQAGLLAQGLEERMPCPVCGSLDHPHPAVVLDEMVNEEAVDQAKAAYEAARLKKEDYLNRLTELNSSMTLIFEQTVRPLALKFLNTEVIKPIDKTCDTVNHLVSINKQLAADKTQASNRAKELILERSKLTEVKTALAAKIENAKEEIKRHNEQLAIKQGELGASLEQLKMIEEEFGGKVKSLEEITSEMLKAQQTLELLVKAYRAAEENHNKQAKALGEADGKCTAADNHYQAALKEKEEAVKLFKEKTLELGFADFSAYKACCMKEDEIEVLDKNIQQFDANLEAAKQMHKKEKEEIKDLKPAELETIKEKIQLAVTVKEKAVKAQQLLFAKMQNNEKVLRDAKELSAKIETKEQKYQMIGELAKLMKGDNAYKISFERYVLAAYFDDIVEASNVRFAKMTSGRFELLRKTQKGDARSQQGLDLEVMDNYTGKARPVETLSGGESFKASLAMALGLADVVQSYAGGIQLDTMFVDEGFGTLDPESLENAISCLMGLFQSGRLVGIISHVPELKERIDARLEVIRVARGSRAEFKL